MARLGRLAVARRPAYMPVVERVTFSGVPPGRYTLVWGPFHAESAAGSVVRAITVPG
ncbi:MAG: hypothetical protein INH41_22480, partial [Myxococcaceae bacterium]|nr:hypothetical protein [Myxococcaceae bacterium]